MATNLKEAQRAGVMRHEFSSALPPLHRLPALRARRLPLSPSLLSLPLSLSLSLSLSLRACARMCVRAPVQVLSLPAQGAFQCSGSGAVVPAGRGGARRWRTWRRRCSSRCLTGRTFRARACLPPPATARRGQVRGRLEGLASSVAGSHTSGQGRGPTAGGEWREAGGGRREAGGEWRVEGDGGAKGTGREAGMRSTLPNRA